MKSRVVEHQLLHKVVSKSAFIGPIVQVSGQAFLYKIVSSVKDPQHYEVVNYRDNLLMLSGRK